MANYKFPRSASLIEVIDRTFEPTLTEDDLIFRYIPIKTTDSSVVRFTQKDNFRGMMGARGMNGQAATIKAIGEKTFAYTPGRYSDVALIDEEILETKGKIAEQTGQAQSVEEEVMERSMQIKHREIVRMKYLAWQAIQGTITVRDEKGAVVFSDSYNVQTAASGTPWTTAATSTPVADLLAAKAAAEATNPGVSFGSGVIILSEKTFDSLLLNRNEADLWGHIKGAGFNGPIGIEGVNQLMRKMGLPTFEIYENTYNYYVKDDGNFAQFLANGKLVWLAARPRGTVVGKYLKTAHANLKGKGGSYYMVKDKSDDVPASIEVHGGHNGGATIEYPGSIIVFTAHA